MRVVHITHSAEGGAGRAAWRSHEACLAVGMESLYVAAADVDPEAGQLKLGAGLADKVDTALWKAMDQRFQWGHVNESRTSATNSLFSVPYPAVDLASSDLIRNCDVVNFHWMSWIASPRTVRLLLEAGKKVVWTLHDFWPMTGGCHYPTICSQYKETCRKCPQLAEPWSVAQAAFNEKLAEYGGQPGLTVLSPSQWLADRASESRIFRDNRVLSIPNTIDLEVFKPQADREELRAALGIKPRDVVLVFGNYDNGETRKGGAALRSALKALSEDWETIRRRTKVGRLVLAVFGRAGAILDGANISTIPFGEVKEDSRLASVLSICDAYLHPASEDNYPNTILESLACGTPVIGFKVGGVPEMVRDGVTGCVEPFPETITGSAAAFRAAIERFVTDHYGSDEMRQACRQQVETENSYSIIGQRFEGLYREITGLPQRETLSSAQVARGARLLQTLSAPPLFELGENMRRFPIGLGLGRLVDETLPTTTTRADADRALKALRAPTRPSVVDKRTRVLVVRTLHSHHSSNSGPHQYLKHLPQDKFAVTEIVTPIGDEFAGRAVEAMKPMVRDMGARGFAHQGNAIVAELAIAREIQRSHFDVVHYIDGDIAGWILPTALKRLHTAGPPPAVIATLHQPEEVLRGLLSFRRLRGFDHVVTLCTSQDDFISAYMGREETTIIPHGIDVDFFTPPPTREFFEPTPQRPLRLVAVGRWLRDYPTLIEAAEQLDMRQFPFTLDIVTAKGTVMTQLPQVTVHHDIDDEKLRALYQQADVLCLPLSDATANNALLEGLASGLPIISTDIGGVPDCVTPECGVLVPRRNSSRLASEVRQLGADTARRRKMSAASRARALELQWPRIAEAHAELYTRIAERRHAATAKTAVTRKK